MEKWLTISVAAYNVERYLDKALESCICKDAIDRLQVIIVDDGSKDGTSSIAKKYQRMYPNTFEYIAKENGGYGSTINKSLKCAKGKYFKLLDGDDWYNTIDLKKLLLVLEKCNSDMIITDYTEVYDGTNKTRKRNVCSLISGKENKFADICSGLSLSMHAVIFKTDIFLHNKISITEKCFYTDAEFLLAPISFVDTVTYFDLDIYQYRLSLSGQSVSLEGMRKHYKDAGKVLYKLIPYVNGLSDSNERKQFMIRNLAVTADFQLRAYLCMRPNEKIKKELKEFDCYIKENQPQIYFEMENTMTRLLRWTNYRTYPLSVAYIFFRMKFIQFVRSK